MSHHTRTALRIAGIYAGCGVLWILFSDRVAAMIAADAHAAVWLQTGKGWIFVIATSALIFGLTRHGLRQLQGALRRRLRSELRREAVERELAEKDRMLLTLMSNVPGITYRCRNDESWTMEFVSDGCTQLTGYDADELVGNRAIAYADLIHADDRDAVWEQVQAAVSRERPFQITYRLLTKTGTERWVWERGRGVFAEGELVALEGFVTDVTEQRELETQLFQSQKLESIGQLAGGIAHDFNNLLTAISGYSEMLLMDMPDDDPRRNDVEEIQKAGRQAAALTGQLLAFSRKQAIEPKVLSLNDVIGDMERMLGRLVGERIEVRTHLAADLAWVKADPGHLQQVILNLVVNARDAMREGGRIVLETANLILDERYAATHLEVEAGPYVMVAVSDTGVGMDEATRARIFEPFFTTKASGQGTGLGLSTVYGIVQQSRGTIWVYSTPGAGTTFKVYLPQVDEAGVPLEPSSVEDDVRGGSETILIVEDERSLQVLMREVLERFGYRVSVASTGAEALRMIGGKALGPELAVIDLSLPDISGRALAERISESSDSIEVLFVSGYADAAASELGHIDRGASFLQKPFTPDALARRVREVLDAGRVPARTP